MMSWLAKKMIACNMARASAGDLGPTLKMDADDVQFRFPGDSSWGGEFNGKAELEPWLQRFADVGLQISPDEVVLKGFPWKQTICIRGGNHLDSRKGERVYDVECLYPDRKLPIPLGDLDSAMPVCNACTAAHIFRPDED